MKTLLLASLLILLTCSPGVAADDQTPIRRAIAYLSSEVPKWPRENRCFSCHNNGDAARALYAARAAGFDVSEEALAQTTAWLAAPTGWSANGGEQEFHDERLATVQFAFALEAAGIAQQGVKEQALALAAKMVADQQGDNGSWPIGAGGAIGAPATYGTYLATYAARRVLLAADSTEFQSPLKASSEWLVKQQPRGNFKSAALLLALRDMGRPVTDSQVAMSLALIRQGEASSGGWGPFANRAVECFDTAIVVLALDAWKEESDCRDILARGREFLIKEQLTEGGWPETTRPANGFSYAEHISTSAWATLALLKTMP